MMKKPKDLAKEDDIFLLFVEQVLLSGPFYRGKLML
jgi:hypothetical protein